MRKQKINYRFYRYEGKMLAAKRKTPFEIEFFARLTLDKLCFTWNKKQLLAQIDEAIDMGDKQRFLELSEAYKQFIWE